MPELCLCTDAIESNLLAGRVAQTFQLLRIFDEGKNSGEKIIFTACPGKLAGLCEYLILETIINVRIGVFLADEAALNNSFSVIISELMSFSLRKLLMFGKWRKILNLFSCRKYFKFFFY